MKLYLILFFTVASCSWVLTPLFVQLGHRLRAYSRDRSRREFQPIPRVGGIAIAAALLLTGLIFLAWSTLSNIPLPPHWQNSLIFLLPVTMILLLGVIDDLRGTRPWQKLLVETVAAAIAWEVGLRILAVPLLGIPMHSSVLSFLLTVLWLVTVTNAFNLIDGLDGLAAGVAFFIAVSLFLISLMQAVPWVAILAVTLAGALVGFLPFNFPPAKLFLGDAGSLFLGFTLAVLAARVSLKSSALVAIAVPYIAFGLPLFDTSLTILRRFLGRRPLFQPDCDHIHHRLLGRKLTPHSAVLVLYSITAFFSMGSLLILRFTGSRTLLLALVTIVVAWLFFRQLRYEEFTALGAYLADTYHNARPTIADEVHMRKVSRQIESAPTLEGSWTLLVTALASAKFDQVAFRLASSFTLPSPFLPPWQRGGQRQTECAWTISIPFIVQGKLLGELHLRRSFLQRSRYFGLSSLHETLLPAFEMQLERRYGGKAPEPLFSRTLTHILRRHRPVLVNQKEKA